MSISSSVNMNLPCIDEFELLKDTFLDLAGEPDSIRRCVSNGNLFFAKLERDYADMDSLELTILTICLSGLIRSFPGGNKMVIRYRELPNNDLTINSSLNHDYFFRTQDGELTEFGHSINAAPKIRQPAQELFMEDSKLNEVQEGTKILSIYTGSQLELTSGDCIILFERMSDLMI